MWRIAMLTTTIGLLMSVHSQVRAEDPPPNVAGGSVEGTVRKIDVATGTIQVSSGLLGRGEKKLQLSEDTLVKVGDREASQICPLAPGKEPRHDNDRDRG
jgi:hypothetical protein